MIVIRKKFNITSRAVFIGLDELVGSFTGFLLNLNVLDLGNVVSNQLVIAFEGKDGNILDPSEWRLWIWKYYFYNELRTPQFPDEFFDFVFFKLSTVLKAAFVFSVISILSSIALHISTISIVIFYILGGIACVY